MDNEKPPIPFSMTLLIVGYFQRTINEAEQAELFFQALHHSKSAERILQSATIIL